MRLSAGFRRLLWMQECLVGLERLPSRFDRQRLRNLALRRLNGTHHLVDCPLARNERVDPVQIGKSHSKTALGLRILDSERDDDLVAFAGDRALVDKLRGAGIFVFVMVGTDRYCLPAESQPARIPGRRWRQEQVE